MSFAPRSIDQLTPEQQAVAARANAAREKVAAKVKAAFEEGSARAMERAQSLLQEAAIAQRADHQAQLDHAGRIMRQHMHAEAWAGRWLGGTVGLLIGLIVGWASYWVGSDQLMQRSFDAASDATARGVAVGAVQRRADGNAP